MLRFLAILSILFSAFPASAQVDQQLAATYFKEAEVLCTREGGRLWGISLCGPMVFADARTHTIATNQAAPTGKQPAALGFANSAMDWDGVRWSTFVWQILPKDPHLRGRLMLHELYHRIQPQLGLAPRDGRNDHLDTLAGRYWMQLEWRALAKALAESGPAQTAAVRDALAFRAKRRELFPDSAESERLLEINEGLAQYTGTVASVMSAAEATADAIDQLAKAPQTETFVRTFAYPSGAAYGILLDGWSPAWPRRVKPADDLGQLLMVAGHVQATDEADAAAKRYGGAELMVAEEKREAAQKLKVEELRRRFVEGPVLVTPPARNNSFTTAGITPIPGAGTVYPTLRANDEWGSLESESALLSTERTVIVPAPAKADGALVTGEGWTLKLAPGWVVRPGKRTGDYVVVRDPEAQK